MNDAELLRYSRQILLPGFDISGQQQLQAARVVIFGLGGLGSPVSLYLAAAGIGEIHLVDFDRVDSTNLQRQIVHQNSSEGCFKVDSARERLLALNPHIRIITHAAKLNDDQLLVLIRDKQALIDCSDNFAARYQTNRVSRKAGVPLISGAAIQFQGQVSVFNTGKSSPCYHCLYPDNGHEDTQNCAENGVLGPLLGVIGSLQAIETIKLITGLGKLLDGQVLIYDALGQDWRRIKLSKDARCPVCA